MMPPDVENLSPTQAFTRKKLDISLIREAYLNRPNAYAKNDTIAQKVDLCHKNDTCEPLKHELSITPSHPQGVKENTSCDTHNRFSSSSLWDGDTQQRLKAYDGSLSISCKHLREKLRRFPLLATHRSYDTEVVKDKKPDDASPQPLDVLYGSQLRSPNKEGDTTPHVLGDDEQERRDAENGSTLEFRDGCSALNEQEFLFSSDTPPSTEIFTQVGSNSRRHPKVKGDNRGEEVSSVILVAEHCCTRTPGDSDYRGYQSALTPPPDGDGRKQASNRTGPPHTNSSARVVDEHKVPTTVEPPARPLLSIANLTTTLPDVCYVNREEQHRHHTKKRDPALFTAEKVKFNSPARRSRRDTPYQHDASRADRQRNASSTDRQHNATLMASKDRSLKYPVTREIEKGSRDLYPQVSPTSRHNGFGNPSQRETHGRNSFVSTLVGGQKRQDSSCEMFTGIPYVNDNGQGLPLSVQESSRFYEVQLELYFGLIGFHVMLVITSFIFANPAGALILLFGCLSAFYSHIDRQSSSYLLTAAILFISVVVLCVSSECDAALHAGVHHCDYVQFQAKCADLFLTKKTQRLIPHEGLWASIHDILMCGDGADYHHWKHSFMPVVSIAQPLVGISASSKWISASFMRMLRKLRKKEEFLVN